MEVQRDHAGKQANVNKVAESLDNYLLQTHQLWTGPKGEITRLEMIVRQTIGVALKSQRSANYIEKVMELDEDAQEDLGVIVQSCLEAIYEGSSSRSSIRSEPDVFDRMDSFTSSDGQRQGRIGLDPEVDNLASSQITVDERKHRDL